MAYVVLGFRACEKIGVVQALCLLSMSSARERSFSSPQASLTGALFAAIADLGEL
jgi:hypothetical protein